MLDLARLGSEAHWNIFDGITRTERLEDLENEGLQSDVRGVLPSDVIHDTVDCGNWV